MHLYHDSKLAISIAHNPVQHNQTKHIEIDIYFIIEKLDRGLICTPYIDIKQKVNQDAKEERNLGIKDEENQKINQFIKNEANQIKG